MSDSLLKVNKLKKEFYINRKQVLKAIDNVSFEIQNGEVLGLVGESGSGKSTIGKTIVRLHKPTSGEIYYKNINIHNIKGKESTGFCKNIQMIFQNPYSTLNPRMTIGEIVGEGYKLHYGATGAELQERVYELLCMVGLDKNHYSRFPHEFSGGQRQRVGIARALSINPEFLICDEPVSALDVSIQAQVINLLIDLKSKMNLTYLFISHDLNIVKYISDRIAVMYLGSIVEIDLVSEKGNRWCHPYSKALLSSVPIPDPESERKRQRIILKGEIPSSINPPNYCRFYNRCPEARPECKEGIPDLKEVEKNHFVACYLYH